MSQYPSPYQPPMPSGPMYGYDPALDNALAPARRAGVLMYVLGAILMLSALCCVGVGSFLPRLMEQQPDAFRELQEIPGASTEIIRVVFFVMSALAGAVGLAMIVLGTFVRRGSKGAVITSIVLAVLAVLFLLAQLAQSMLMSRNMAPAQMAGGICIMVIPLALFVLLLVWLIQSLRSAGEAQAIQSRYLQQYWQYTQQQQAYQQHFPPTAPPPPPPPPPPSSTSE